MIASNSMIQEINGSYREIFINAVSRNDIGTVESLIDNNNAQLVNYKFSIDPVHICVSRDYLELLEILLTAEFSGIVREGVLQSTPLMNAVIANNKFAVESLLKFNTGINLQDELGQTALHKAALSPDTKESIFKMLIKAGADNSIVDKQLKNPGYWAKTNECKFKSLDEIQPKNAMQIIKHRVNELKVQPKLYVQNPTTKQFKIKDDGIAKHKLFKDVKPKPPKGSKKK